MPLMGLYRGLIGVKDKDTSKDKGSDKDTDCIVNKYKNIIYYPLLLNQCIVKDHISLESQ